MDRDELWLSWDLDAFEAVIGTDDQYDEFSLHESYVRALNDRLDDEIAAHEQWLNRRLNRHRRRPKRQLHPCLNNQLHRVYRDLTTYSHIDRELIRRRIRARDLDDQLNDYVADQVTDVPSVGLTVGNTFFRLNVGEYPLVYSEPADYEDDWDLLEADREPEWLKAGFESEEEYLQYLDDVSWFYEPAWDDRECETASM